MTAVVKTRKINNETGAIQVNFTNSTKVRQCTLKDFNRTDLPNSFNDLTIPINNFYCPESYENVT